MNILLATLKILKLPLKIIVWLVGSKKKRPQKTELEQKQIKHVRNFAPTHYSWQKGLGKYKKKKGKFVKRTKTTIKK